MPPTRRVLGECLINRETETGAKSSERTMDSGAGPRSWWSSGLHPERWLRCGAPRRRAVCRFCCCCWRISSAAVSSPLAGTPTARWHVNTAPPLRILFETKGITKWFIHWDNIFIYSSSSIVRSWCVSSIHFLSKHLYLLLVLRLLCLLVVQLSHHSMFFFF